MSGFHFLVKAAVERDISLSSATSRCSAQKGGAFLLAAPLNAQRRVGGRGGGLLALLETLCMLPNILQ